ncbi:hypothetical protein BDFB_013664 [Asbolus verrucosus]|uniref:Uncharacterized protein n=1 Tax=Asbolus verrucosus TaxID=1661398 RepID=A0A482VGH7_ASBVE|nr:hypothetical protein BDFB_013664 [Asbolus verrucosus]
MAQFVPVVIILELDTVVYPTPFTNPDSYAGALCRVGLEAAPRAERG